MASIEIKGLKELQKKLERLPVELSEKVSADVNRSAANSVKRELKSATPSRNSKRKVKIKKSVAVAKIPQTKNSFQVGWLKKAFWIRFFVFGTQPRQTKKSDAKRGSMPSRDFVTPTLSSILPKIAENLNKNYQKIIQKVLK